MLKFELDREYCKEEKRQKQIKQQFSKVCTNIYEVPTLGYEPKWKHYKNLKNILENYTTNPIRNVDSFLNLSYIKENLVKHLKKE